MKANKHFYYFQPNRKNAAGKEGDCVIRAFACATGRDWLSIFDELVQTARENWWSLNGKNNYQAFLNNNGFKYTGISNKKGSHRPTTLEFCKQHKVGTFVLVLANHLTCVKDSINYDTWDCKDCSLYGYWEKQN